MEMLCTDSSVDAHALACVLYILRVGVTDQMTEPTQRGFLVFLGKQLRSSGASPSMKIAALRTMSYTLKTLGEVPIEFKEVFDDAVLAAVSHPLQLVRVEAALTLRVLAEVDPTCVGGLVSYGVTTLSALRETILFGKGTTVKFELDSLHGQASVLAALVAASPKLPLGYPARLPNSVLEVSKRMLTESSRNPIAATALKEAGWLLLSSLLSSMPKEELEDQVFDILSLWATLFSKSPEQETNQGGDLTSKICVWSAAVDALAAFVRCFITSSSVDNGILLQPVLVYLSSALSYISVLKRKDPPKIKPALDIFIIRTLTAYRTLPDPMAFKRDHTQMIQLCTIPFREASKYEESSCLRLLLDRKDAWLGPWIPARDSLEDELRAFQGGEDGLVPCIWESEVSSFPQPETINKMLVNQMLLCFGLMFSTQESKGMLSLLQMIEQCLKAGKKQTWHAASLSNICVGLLAGLKALIALRPQSLGPEILSLAHAIFQSILAEGEICASQRRAAAEGLGLLARLGNDLFTAKMTRSLLRELAIATDSNYAGTMAFAIGCIHRSAGGMALSSLVPASVASLSTLAKSPITGLQIWSLHGLLLTIEDAGFSYVSHVQATLGLATDILLSEENGLVDLQQGVARLINAIVAVLGPELAPGSIFFSRCKSVIAEISSWHETATLLESVRFTQQLVLFAPRAVSVHSHVQTLLSTLSSRQPTLRHVAVSTLRHLIEKDPVSVINEQIEDTLFHMLDEETDSEIGNLVRATIMRLLNSSCPSKPSHWISVCRKMVLATSATRDAERNDLGNNSLRGLDSESKEYGEDDEDMVSSSTGTTVPGYESKISAENHQRVKQLRYRTRVFAAECLSCLPDAVGKNTAHFDLSFARRSDNGSRNGAWLVLHLQDLISLAYQISTIQFENMRPIGVALLSTIVDKFEAVSDPELPGHLLLEQYQAQLVSAVRTALDASSGPILLEAGLQLATKIMTSGILGGDQVAVKRIFLLISRPLDEFKDIYYPSFAEWVSCKIKIRLLAAHASLKCYAYAFLRRHQSGVPDEYLALLPLFSKNSSILGKHWIHVLKDYSYVCLQLNLKKKWNLFDGIQSPLALAKLQPILQEVWPIILQALALDAVPFNFDADSASRSSLISGYTMVELDMEDYHFVWGFALLVLFQRRHSSQPRKIIPITSAKDARDADAAVDGKTLMTWKLHEVVLPVFQFLSTHRFFTAGFLTVDVCKELLQVFSYSIYMDSSWNSLALSVLSQIVENCPTDFLKEESIANLVIELILVYIFNIFQSSGASSESSKWKDLTSSIFNTAKTLVSRLDTEIQGQLKSTVLAFTLISCKCVREATSELYFSAINDFSKSTSPLLKALVKDSLKQGEDCLRAFLGTSQHTVSALTKDCIKGMHLLKDRSSDLRKLLQMKLCFSLEQTVLIAKLAYEFCHVEEVAEKSSICLSVFRRCTDCLHMVLSDSDLQVQVIGLQVLKSLVQKSSNVDDRAFLVLLSGEVIGDVFTIIQSMLKKPVSKESVAVLPECLRLLLLLQTLSTSKESQRSSMVLFLRAVITIFLSSEDDYSQELDDVKAVAVKLVSQVAQIPSSAAHFKDVLLSMPVAHRQMLQGIIRASVAQDHNASPSKSLVAPLEIKLPLPKDSQPSPVKLPETSPAKVCVPAQVSVHDPSEEEDDEDDDDWDSFQSIPASSNVAAAESKAVNSDAEEPKMESENEASQSSINGKEIGILGDDESSTAEISSIIRAGEDYVDNPDNLLSVEEGLGDLEAEYHGEYQNQSDAAELTVDSVGQGEEGDKEKHDEAEETEYALVTSDENKGNGINRDTKEDGSKD
ncbi:Protein SWEETIE [Linum grandiflorum]